MSELNDMSCAEFADVAAELALGVLTGRERAEALAHIDRCDACREHVRQLTITGEELLGLLPAAEPPPGFETQVMERFGLAVPVPRPARLGRRIRGRRIRGRQPEHAGLTRRMLAAAAVLVAIVGAGLGGWGLHAATSPSAGSTVSSAALLSAGHQNVGEVFMYNGNPRWMYMSVDMGSGTGTGTVTCQLESADGHLTTIGSFRLTGGYGSWGSPAWSSDGAPVSARLLAANGTVLATASFPGASALFAAKRVA